MGPGFAYFLLKKNCGMTIRQLLHDFAQYIHTPNLEKYPETQLNVLQVFLVLCNSYNSPRSSFVENKRLDATKRNKGLKLDAFDDIVPNKKDKTNYNDNNKTTKTVLDNLSKSIRYLTSLFPEKRSKK